MKDNFGSRLEVPNTIQRLNIKDAMEGKFVQGMGMRLAMYILKYGRRTLRQDDL